MNNIYAFLGVIILCLLTPIAMLGIHRAQVETYEQLAPAVVTGVGETDAEIILVELPEPTRSSSITKLQSTNVPDIIVITAYDPATKTLTIDGLEAEITRSIEITYLIEAEFMTDLPFIGSVFMVIMYLMPIGLLMLIIAVVVSAFRR